MSPVKELKDLQEWKNLLEISVKSPVLLFKFSPVCPLSHYAEGEFQSFLQACPEELIVFSVNVIASRSVSKQAAADLDIIHKSPQILLISKGKCLWNESHSAITAEFLRSKTTQNI